MIDDTVYRSAPLRVVNGIPVFSERDAYVDNYDQISADHLAALDATGENPFMREDHWREIERDTEAAVKRHVAAGARILDVGVGLGRLLEKFPTLRRYGLDISMKYLERAKVRGIEVCMARVEEMPYRPEVFDVVVATDVLEHVLDLNLALDRMLMVLKPGGMLIVRTPYREDLSGYLDPRFPYRLAHLRSFDEYSARLLVERVFDRQLLEISLSGYLAGAPRLFAGNQAVVSVVRRLVALTGALNEGLALRLAKALNRPAEIGWVVCNRSLSSILQPCAESRESSS